MLSLSFLFDNYGLYHLELIDNSFIINDDLYKIEEIRMYSEENFSSLDTFSKEIYRLFNKTYKIHKNRKNEYISLNGDKIDFDSEKCIYCRTCEAICPLDAIRIVNFR